MSEAVLDDLKIPQEHARPLVTAASYATDELHNSLTWLRANNPLGIVDVEGFDPFWAVTKHADILHISKNNELFHNGDRATTLTDQASLARTHEITGTPHLVRSLVQMDNPDHMKYRRLTQAHFMPPKLKEREAEIGEIADRTVARMMDRDGQCDFVADVALHYPLEVVMKILGVPEEDYSRMLTLTQELFGPLDPDTARQVAELSAAQYAMGIQAVVEDFTAYFEKISEDRRANPRNDLATVIANAEIDGKPIPPFEATGYYMIVATAGHDTTSSSTAGAMWALATVPGLLDRVKADPSLIPNLVEEAIRWTTPVKTFMRSATADTELRGRKIAKGDWLMLCYASGNRDEDVFDNPFTFDIDRNPNKQLAFGYGGHLCLGQHLARMEMKSLFERLLPKLKSVKLAGEPKMIESTFVNGLKRLPIEFEAA